MRTANAVFRALCEDCASFQLLWDDAIADEYKAEFKMTYPKLKASVLRKLADEIEKEGDQ